MEEVARLPMEKCTELEIMVTTLIRLRVWEVFREHVTVTVGNGPTEVICHTGTIG